MGAQLLWKDVIEGIAQTLPDASRLFKRTVPFVPQGVDLLVAGSVFWNRRSLDPIVA
jgi:hypothetical protein